MIMLGGVVDLFTSTEKKIVNQRHQILLRPESHVLDAVTQMIG